MARFEEIVDCSVVLYARCKRYVSLNNDQNASPSQFPLVVLRTFAAGVRAPGIAVTPSLWLFIVFNW